MLDFLMNAMAESSSFSFMFFSCSGVRLIKSLSFIFGLLFGLLINVIIISSVIETKIDSIFHIIYLFSFNKGQSWTARLSYRLEIFIEEVTGLVEFLLRVLGLRKIDCFLNGIDFHDDHLD